MTEAEAYRLDSYAFSLETREERADAFEVAADALDEAGLHKAAQTRRSWAQTLRRPKVIGHDNPDFPRILGRHRDRFA